MDFGAGDVAAGIRLCIVLYQYGFSPDNAADVRYINFRNDLHNFESLLRTLQDSLQRAHRRATTRLVLDRSSLDALADDFERERKAIVGNFNATLQECKDFLESRRHYTARPSNPFENLAWHFLHDEQHVNDLRQRIAFHMFKIRFVIDRLSLTTLTDLDANVEDTRALAEENLQVSQEALFEVKKFKAELFGYLAGQSSLPPPPSNDRHVASRAIAQRFQESFNSKVSIEANARLPLEEGFDALLGALEQSNEGLDQTPETYLAFLKARWLMIKVEQSTEYQEARPGFYFKRAIRQISKALKAKLSSPGDLIQFEDDHLLALPAGCFAIWKPTATPATEEIELQFNLPRGDEVEVAQIELATTSPGRTDRLTLFKRSDVQFRSVREVTSPAATHQVQVPLQIDVREDSLVPQYLLPTLQHPSLELSVLSRGEIQTYRFQQLEDIYRLQSAFTGFEVSHDQTSIICQFSRSARHLDCTARIQLWQEPLDSQAFEPAVSPISQGSGAVNSGSGAGTHVSFAPTTTVAQTPHGFEAQRIKRCAITLISEVRDKSNQPKFAITFLPLPDDCYIDEDLCSCRRGYDACSKLVLTRMKKKPLPVRFRQCDLNSFDLLQFRLNSSFDKAQRADTDHLIFKFPNLEDKTRFHRELNLRFAVRNAQFEDQSNFGREFRQRQDQPQRQSRGSQQGDRRRPSNVPGTSLTPSRLPQLPPIERGPAFSSGMEGGAMDGRDAFTTAPLATSTSNRASAPEVPSTDSDSAIDIRDSYKAQRAGAANTSPRVGTSSALGSGGRGSFPTSRPDVGDPYTFDAAVRSRGLSPRQATSSFSTTTTATESGTEKESRWKKMFKKAG